MPPAVAQETGSPWATHRHSVLFHSERSHDETGLSTPANLLISLQCLQQHNSNEISDALDRCFSRLTVLLCWYVNDKISSVLYLWIGCVPALSGDSICKCTLVPPALCPKIVTQLGFPPNAAMLFWTQCRAATWSFSPKLPGAILSAVLRNPAGTSWNLEVSN